MIQSGITSIEKDGLEELRRELPPLPDHLGYVAVEGVIGAGKSTLALYLARMFDGQVIMEEFEKNPFLPQFYQDRERWGFQTQLSFLASRFKQQKALLARDLFHQVVFSDYTFDKDRIFAHLNLAGDELHLYETMYTIMEPNTPRPDLVIYLQASPDRLMHNIAVRNRSFEKNMDRKYIEALAEAYDYYFFRYTKSPLLIVNASRIDFVKYPNDFKELVRQIVTMRHMGITYINPPPSADENAPTMKF